MQKFGHVGIAVLLDEIDIIVSHDCVLQCDNVWVFQLHQDCNFSYRRGWNTVIAIVYVCPLYRVLLLCLTMHASVDGTVGALAKLVHPIVLIKLVILAQLLLLLWLRRLLILLLRCFRHYAELLPLPFLLSNLLI